MALRIGILGGTFDPPHVAHLVLAEAARVEFALDRIVLLPAGDPYHKRPGSGFALVGHRSDVTRGETRVRLARLAAEGDPHLVVDAREVSRQGPTYTVDTLEEYAAEAGHEQRELFLLLGADAAAEIGRWKRPERIGELATVLVAPRGDVRLPTELPVRFAPVDMPRLDVTSTLIRDRVRRGRSVRYLVPRAVEAAIEAERLYRPLGPDEA